MSGMFGPQELCGVVGKEMFKDKKAARAALAAYGRRKGCRRTHWCPFCNHHHMTKGQRGNRMKAGGR